MLFNWGYNIHTCRIAPVYSSIIKVGLVSGPDLLVMGGANGYGKGLVNCTYTSCALCAKSCRPIRLQIANHTYEHNTQK